jgi:class 3 adenylate cyclase
MKRITAIIIFCFASICGSAQSKVVLQPNSGLVNIGKEVNTFFDKSSKVTVNDILSGKYNDKFQNLHTDFFSWGITHGTSWCRFKIENPRDEKIYLSVESPNLDTVRLYKIKDGKAILIGKGGIYYPLDSKQVKTENFMFDLQIVHDSGEYLLSVDRFRAHAYGLKVGKIEDFLQESNRMSLFNAIYIGFILMIMFYNIFLFITIRDRTYLYYVFYAGFLGLFNATVNGMAYIYLWPSQNATLNYYGDGIAMLGGFFGVLFCINFLRIKKYSALFYRLLILLEISYCIALIILLSRFQETAFILLQVITFLGIGIQIISAIIAMARGFKAARLFLIAWGSLMAGLVIFALASNGIITYNFFTGHCLQVGSSTEIMILLFALADRLNTSQKEKDSLMKHQNEMLELKVEERTRELNREKEASENLLLNILPAETAEELKVKGSIAAKDYSLVTVMFTDFKDFTRIGEQMSAGQLVKEIDYCFSSFDTIVQKHGIEKIKTIGDSYMCAGGLPAVNKTHATDVINAALDIMVFMRKHKEEKEATGEIPFEIRIGINTGPVVAGIVGIRKFAYDIWGDAVNIAARMESSGEEGKINISGATYELVKDKFKCTYRGKVMAKHKGEIDMYFVEG